MISSTLVAHVLSSIFIDEDSIYMHKGFELSLHRGGAVESAANEISGKTYSRVPIGCGEAYWTLGARVVVNNTDIMFPPTDPSEVIRGIRTLVVWSVEYEVALFALTLDSPGVSVGEGDALIIPAGGLVIGFG